MSSRSHELFARALSLLSFPAFGFVPTSPCTRRYQSKTNYVAPVDETESDSMPKTSKKRKATGSTSTASALRI